MLPLDEDMLEVAHNRGVQVLARGCVQLNRHFAQKVIPFHIHYSRSLGYEPSRISLCSDHWSNPAVSRPCHGGLQGETRTDSIPGLPTRCRSPCMIYHPELAHLCSNTASFHSRVRFGQTISPILLIHYNRQALNRAYLRCPATGPHPDCVS